MKRFSLCIVFLLAACASAPAPYLDDRIDPTVIEGVSVETSPEPMIRSTIPEIVAQDASEPQ